MTTISVDNNSIVVIIKSKSYREIYYQILPSIAYTGRELIPYGNQAIFNELNIYEDVYDLILIGKKITKHQLETIKNEILQKTPCEIKHYIFEYDGIFETIIDMDINYNRIKVDGIYQGKEIKYSFFNNLWTENIDTL